MYRQDACWMTQEYDRRAISKTSIAHLAFRRKKLGALALAKDEAERLPILKVVSNRLA